MKQRLQMALAATISVWCPAGHATQDLSGRVQAAFEECLARWNDVDGTWEGRLLKPGAYDKGIHVKLVFSRNGTTLLVKDELGQPWSKVGDDPRPATLKTNLLLRFQTSDARDPRVHQITFERFRESYAKVIHSRVQIDPKIGGVVSMSDLRAGMIVREGSPFPTGRAAAVWECEPK